MNSKSIEDTKHVLAEEMKKYVEIILKEYGKYIPKERQEFLKSFQDFDSRIVIRDTGSISMCVYKGKLYLPQNAYKIFKLMKMIPGYGSNKEHKSYKKGEIINKNTYYDYIKHMFISGMSAEEFFRDTLLHETMHFCGSGGGSALREGINELKTRELAQKYGLKASRCGYPKEVEIANRLQNLVGEEIMNEISFATSDMEAFLILRAKCGTEIANLFQDITINMNKELRAKYDHSKFGGIFGPIKKARAYSKIDYSTVYERLDEFENNLSRNNNFRSQISYDLVNEQNIHQDIDIYDRRDNQNKGHEID